MGRTLGKRDIEQVDPTVDDNAHAPAQKANRASEGQPASNGQRFGEDTQFVPLSHGQDEDDEQAAGLIQGSQDMDDSVYSTYMLYGMLRH